MKKELQVLVLEDVASDVVLINHELRKAGLEFRTKRVETREDFLRELQSALKQAKGPADFSIRLLTRHRRFGPG